MSKIGDMVYLDLKSRSRSLRTADRWRVWVEMFVGVCGEKDGYSRNDVVQFLNFLSGKYCQNSINTVLRAVKLLAEIQGWNFPRLAMGKVRRDDIKRPALEYEEIHRLIKCARRGMCGRYKAFLALSTVYGLRRKELCNIDIVSRENGIDYIRVKTVKGGETVEQVVPSEIKEYLVGYRKSDISNASHIFKRIMKKAGFDGRYEGYGWHSIRRALTTELVRRGVSVVDIVRFMRWSEGSLLREIGTLALYVRCEQERIDRAVFAFHPFLPMWKE